MKQVDPFPRLLRSFFCEWMVEQRNASVHTIRSYRDTWRLFLRFVAQRRRQTVAQLTLADLTATEVSDFLRYTEQERHDSIGTRNCRLAALRSFFNFVAGREPTAIGQCAEILRIPTKKAVTHAPCYLEPVEVEAILAQPDRLTLEGQRDHALFSFLYNTGARIQEALDVCPERFAMTRPLVCTFLARVGKNVSVHCGRKQCRCLNRCSNGNQGRMMNRSSSIVTVSRWAHRACVLSSLNTLRQLLRTCRACLRSTLRPTASVTRLRCTWWQQELTSR